MNPADNVYQFSIFHVIMFFTSIYILLDIGHLYKESVAEIHIKIDLLVLHVTIIAINLFYLDSFLSSPSSKVKGSQ